MNLFQSPFRRIAVMLMLSFVAAGGALGQGAASASADRPTTATLGRNKIIPSFHVDAGSTLGDALDRIGKEFGVSIQVVASAPNTPESIDFVKKLQFPEGLDWEGTGVYISGRRRQGGLGMGGRGRADGVSLDGLLLGIRSGLLNRITIGYEWKDDKSVEVFASDYEARTDQVRKTAALDAARDKFFTDEEPKTQIYKLEGISPKTAFALIQRELTKTGLWRIGEGFSVLTEKEAMRRGLGEPSYSVEDTASLDDAAGTAIVTATPQTHERIQKVLDNAADFLKQSNAEAPIRQYKIDLALLRGTPDGAAAAAHGRQVKIYAKSSGTVAECSAARGRTVTSGTLLLKLDSSQLQSRLGQMTRIMELAEQQRQLAKAEVQRQQQLADTGIVTPGELQRFKSELLNKEQALEDAQANISQAQSMIEDLAVRAPIAGTIVSTGKDNSGIGINESIRAGDLIAVIEEAPQASGAGAAAASESSADAATAAGLKTLGLKPEDLKDLGVSSCEMLGRATVSLNNLPGEDGTALVTLAGRYQCKLSYIDRRDPLLMVRAAIQTPAGDADAIQKNAQTLTENTLFLEKGKPSVLGLSNMQEALILVVRELEEVSVAPTNRPAAAPDGEAAATAAGTIPAPASSGEFAAADAEGRAMAAQISKAIATTPRDTRKSADLIRDYTALFGANSKPGDSEFLKPLTSGFNAAQQRKVVDDKYFGYLGAQFVKSLGEHAFQIQYVTWNQSGQRENQQYKVTLGTDGGKSVIVKDERLP